MTVDTPGRSARHRAAPGPRSAWTRDWRPTPSSAPASWPGSAPPGRASGPASPGCSGATRSGPSLAIHSYGDFDAARTALEFLRKLQRDDGKIPHEISQSASLVPWFKDYKYPWESADATPLYVVLQADHWRYSGDRDFLRASWDSIVEGVALLRGHRHRRQRPHREHDVRARMDGGQPALSSARGDLPPGNLDRGRPRPRRDGRGHGRCLAGRQARAAAERTRAAVEKTYWLADRGFYAFATALAKPEKEYKAEAGPRRAARQARIDALRGRTIVDEDTVLPAVPAVVAHARSRARRARDRPPRVRRHGRGLGPAPDLGEERALRSALVSLRLGVAAVHGLGLDGRVPVRPAPRRIPGP